MSEIKIKDRLIDPLQGAVKVLDVDHNNRVEFLIERTGAKCYRPLHKVLQFKKAPAKRKTIRFIRRVVVTVGTVLAFGAIAVLAVIIYSNVRVM